MDISIAVFIFAAWLYSAVLIVALHDIWVIPKQFNKNFYMTLSELDETWCVSSTCGFMKPDEVSFLLVWLLGKGH